MNTYFLDRLKVPVLNFIKQANDTDLNIVLGKFYRRDALEFFSSLREKDLPVRFVEGFPLQSTQLPAFSFILGNDDSTLPIQTYSYETEEIPDEQYQRFLSLLKKINPLATQAHIKCWVHQSQILIGVHALNKIEVTWLCLMLDFILKSLRDSFYVEGILDLSFNFTDLRVTSELFKLQSSSRICQISFKYQKFVPEAVSSDQTASVVEPLDINFNN